MIIRASVLGERCLTNRFFTGFHKLLGGRKPSATLEKLLKGRSQIDVLCCAQLKSHFGPLLPE
jgi:hypothetical protein